mmetsp:Transcript_21774/g.68214  ORF Transcript_21774/g.68214 Transcript_21774/m.68214 type:complete len:207 (-) Transcript_21774:236-856(-)
MAGRQQKLSEMDKESERLRELLAAAQREGEMLKARAESLETPLEAAAAPEVKEDKQLLATLVNLVDSPAQGEEAPSYAELMETAGVVTPSAEASLESSLDSFSEPSDDDDAADERPLAAGAAARITIENIRSQAHALSRDAAPPVDRIDRLLERVNLAPSDNQAAPPAPPANQRAAEAARQLLASMRAEAEAYAQQRAKEREDQAS